MVTTLKRLAVEFVSRSDLLEERARLVARSGLSLEELREKGAVYEVSVEQRDILDEIDGIEFLLEDDQQSS